MSDHGDTPPVAAPRAPSYPAPSFQPASGLPRWILPALLGGAAVIVALLVVIVILLVGAGDDKSASATDSPKESETKTFDVAGDITLIDAGVYGQGKQCFGQDGYDDMSAGTQVVVRDSTGKTLAAGSLGVGEKTDTVQCVFPFHVDDVPSGAGPYSIEVSHRGETTFTEEQAEDLHYTLG